MRMKVFHQGEPSLIVMPWFSVLFTPHHVQIQEFLYILGSQTSSWMDVSETCEEEGSGSFGRTSGTHLATVSAPSQSCSFAKCQTELGG